MSPRICAVPFMQPSQRFGRRGAGGTISATGFPKRVTRMGFRVRRTPSSTARQVALNLEMAISSMTPVLQNILYYGLRPWSIIHPGILHIVFTNGAGLHGPKFEPRLSRSGRETLVGRSSRDGRSIDPFQRKGYNAACPSFETPIMPSLSRLLVIAARRLAANPEVRAKVAEVVEKDIKPRAQQAWQKNKPKIEAKAAELNEQIRRNATSENFDKLANKVRDRLRERSKPSS